jgi:hypothetical protein
VRYAPDKPGANTTQTLLNRQHSPILHRNRATNFMKKYLLLLSQPVWAQSTVTDGRKTFAIPSFRTEGGVTLPKATIVYGIYGYLNAARDNAILLPSH